MSARTSNKKVRKSKGMNSAMGPSQTYMNKESNGKYARGAKKGTRRARRRLDKEVIQEDKD
jgi:hypothetical protein